MVPLEPLCSCIEIILHHKDWFLKLGKEFTSWIEMEDEFLRKYYSVGKTTSV